MTTIVQEIPLKSIDVHRLNPRAQDFAGADFDGLVESIRAQGVLQPILAVRDNGGYALIDGSRRLAAARKAGKTTIPTIVEEAATDEQVAEIALTSNLQREDLTPLEEARGYRAWLELTKKTQVELAKRVGKAPSTIANALRLLEAAPAIQEALEKGTITAAHAKVAMSLPEKALPLLDLKADVSVHELEEQANAAKRSHAALERLRTAIEKAEKAGKVVTWDTHDRDFYIGGAEIDLVKALGEPKKKLAGILQQGYGAVTKAIHDEHCDCVAVAIHYHGELIGACVSPSGWKKAEAEARKAMGRATPTQKKKAKTAEQKKKEVERDEKAAVKEAAEALDFKKLRNYHPLKSDVPAALLKGGIAGEPARLVLFGFVVENSGGSNRSKTWEVQLWKQIAKLSLKDVRERVTKWAVAYGLEGIRGTNRYKGYGSTGTPLGSNNASVITQLVNAHYGVRAKAKKAAKR